MADLQRLKEAFLAADKAGNTEDAAVFAEAIRKQSSQSESVFSKINQYASIPGKAATEAFISPTINYLGRQASNITGNPDIQKGANEFTKDLNVFPALGGPALGAPIFEGPQITEDKRNSTVGKGLALGGQLVGGLGVSLIPGVGQALLIGSGAVAGAEGQLARADAQEKATGKPVELSDRVAASLLGGAASALAFALPIKYIKSAMFSNSIGMIKNAAKQGGINAGIAMANQIAQNLTTKGFIDPKQDATEGVAEVGISGLAGGAVLGGMFHGRTPPPTPTPSTAEARAKLQETLKPEAHNLSDADALQRMSEKFTHPDDRADYVKMAEDEQALAELPVRIAQHRQAARAAQLAGRHDIAVRALANAAKLNKKLQKAQDRKDKAAEEVADFKRTHEMALESPETVAKRTGQQSPGAETRVTDSNGTTGTAKEMTGGGRPEARDEIQQAARIAKEMDQHQPTEIETQLAELNAKLDAMVAKLPRVDPIPETPIDPNNPLGAVSNLHAATQERALTAEGIDLNRQIENEAAATQMGARVPQSDAVPAVGPSSKVLPASTKVPEQGGDLEGTVPVTKADYPLTANEQRPLVDARPYDPNRIPFEGDDGGLGMEGPVSEATRLGKSLGDEGISTPPETVAAAQGASKAGQVPEVGVTEKLPVEAPVGPHGNKIVVPDKPANLEVLDPIESHNPSIASDKFYDEVGEPFPDQYRPKNFGQLVARAISLLKGTDRQLAVRLWDKLKMEDVDVAVVWGGDHVPIELHGHMNGVAHGVAYVKQSGKQGVMIRGETGGAKTVLHELVHLATQRGLNKPENAALFLEISKFMHDFHDRMLSIHGIDGDLLAAFRRAIDTPHEMLAYGMTSDSFKATLKSISEADQAKFKPKFPRTPELTMYQKFVDFVRRLLTLEPRYSKVIDKLLSDRNAKVVALNDSLDLIKKVNQLFERAVSIDQNAGSKASPSVRLSVEKFPNKLGERTERELNNLLSVLKNDLTKGTITHESYMQRRAELVKNWSAAKSKNDKIWEDNVERLTKVEVDPLNKIIANDKILNDLLTSREKLQITNPDQAKLLESEIQKRYQELKVANSKPKVGSSAVAEKIKGPTNTTPANDTITTTNPQVAKDPAAQAKEDLTPTTINRVEFRKMHEGAADTYIRHGLHQVGKAIRNWVDDLEANLGAFTHYMRPGIDALSKLPKAQRVAVEKEYSDYQMAVTDKRYADATKMLSSMSDPAFHLVDSTTNALKDFHDKATAANVRNSTTGKVIGYIKHYFPLTLNERYAKAMNDPRNPKYKEAFNEIAEEMIKRGTKNADGKVLKTVDDVYDYLANGELSNQLSDHVGNLELSRQNPLPSHMYDFTLDALNRYRNRAATRISQIKNFGQNVPGEKEMFHKLHTEGKIDNTTKAYIEATARQIYGTDLQGGFLDLHWGAKVGNVLGTLSTGLFIGNPVSASVNLLGGVTNTIAVYGVRNSIKGLQEMFNPTTWKAAYDEAMWRGAARDDKYNMWNDPTLGEQNTFTPYEKAMRISQKFNQFTLKYGGFTLAEGVVRVHAMLAFKHVLNDGLSFMKTKPGSVQDRTFRSFVKRAGLDADVLLKESTFEAGEAKPETDRMIRRGIDLPQGSYNIDQVPLWANSQGGKFFFKFYKFLTQQSRSFVDQGVKPIFEAKHADERADASIRLLRYLAVGYLAGYAGTELKDKIFGYLQSTPGLDEAREAFKNKETAEAFGTLGKHVWGSFMLSGSFGVYGQLGDTGFHLYKGIANKDVDEMGKVRSPVQAPGFAPIAALADLLSRRIQQGTLTANDIDQVTQQLSSGYKAAKNVAQKVTYLTDDSITFGRLQALDYERGFAQRFAKQYAAENGLKDDRDSGFKQLFNVFGRDINRTPQTPDNREIKQALMLGDVGHAQSVITRLINGATTEDELRKVQASARAAVEYYDPLYIPGIKDSPSSRKDFLAWLNKTVDKKDYDRIVKTGKDYHDAAVKSGFYNPDKPNDAYKAKKRADDMAVITKQERDKALRSYQRK